MTARQREQQTGGNTNTVRKGRAERERDSEIQTDKRADRDTEIQNEEMQFDGGKKRATRKTQM